MNDLDQLRRHELLYLATPYSKYPTGLDAAFRDAVAHAGMLLKLGLNVYSPIVHMHLIAMYCQMDPLDHELWLRVDLAMMAKADALLVATTMPGWEKSKGIQHEIEFFLEADKPIYYWRAG